MNYLFDTNALIYLLKGKTKLLPISENDNLLISFITKIELLSHKSTSDEEDKINKLLNNCEIEFIDNELIYETIDIRKKHGLKLPDSIIAATAVLNAAILITSDSHIINKASDLNIRIFNPL